MTGWRPGRAAAVRFGSLAVAVLLPHAAAAAGAGPCGTTLEAHLVVTSVERRVTLCYERREVKSFKVRLARNGPGKIRAGDARLPLGTYKLGVPRDSE